MSSELESNAIFHDVNCIYGNNVAGNSVSIFDFEGTAAGTYYV